MNNQDRTNTLYHPNVWARESKAIHRRWIADMVEKYQQSILVNGKLKSNLYIATLSGFYLDELEWFLNNRPIFNPSQYLAIDRKSIDLGRANTFGLPIENVHIGLLEHELRTLRTVKDIAIINADVTTTLSSCISDINSLIKSAQNCCDRVGECFLFVNSIAEILHCKKITSKSDEAYRFICEDLSDTFFHSCKESPLKREFLVYHGNRTDTLMLCFCIHLIKGA